MQMPQYAIIIVNCHQNPQVIHPCEKIPKTIDNS